MGEVCGRTGWRIYAFVLMTNHYHLLLETPEPNLVAGMKWLRGTYTQRFNRRHNVGGHLFQGRYKALVIEGEESGYFLQVSSYIHLNPIRGGLVRTDNPLRSYRWSSFPLYLIPASRREIWLGVDRVLGELGGHQDNRRGRQSYEVYIEGLAERIRDKKELKSFDEKWGLIRRGWHLGGEDFKVRLLDRVDKVRDGKERETYYGDEVRAHDEAQAEKLLWVGLGVLELKEQDLKKMAKGVKEKKVLAWWLRKKTMVSRKWISQRLGMGDVSRITQAVSLLNRNEDISLVRLKKLLEGIS